MIDLLVTVAVWLYSIGAGFLVIFVGSFGILLSLYLLKRNDTPRLPQINDNQLPSVTIQLPIYNERTLVDRLLEACTHLDYPADKLHIQVIDDSTDETFEAIKRKACELEQRGFDNITYHHRSHRNGFKAGALTYGTQFINTEFIAVFDADFVPDGDFLRRSMPYFVDNPGLALVQTRWSHLNRHDNWLTRAQALNIDAHFAIEQVARSRGKLPMSMNGTGGIWRLNAIKDAGGWSAATLAEDLDLSYRAYLCGWDFLFLVDVTAPGELPPLLSAYKTQQARWAIGSTQCLLRHSGRLLRDGRSSLLKKLMGLMHLSQYIVQPVILLMFLLMPLLLWDDAVHRVPNFSILAVLGVIPPMMIALGQLTLHKDGWRHLAAFPVQFMLAAAITLSNSLAILSTLFTPSPEFKRTPKFHTDDALAPSLTSHYVDGVTLGELLLSGYALLGFALALKNLPTVAPYMLVHALAFAVLAFWNIYQRRQFNQQSRTQALQQ